ncbi:hypothetical protein N9924_01130 [bacterium]|nr:hypothetical protein [bacterium]
MSWCDEHGTDGGCSECADEYWKKELAEKEKEIERLRGAMNIEIGDFIMVDDEPQFVSAIVSDPVLRVYYWLDNEELSVTIDEIDCHFVNMNRVKEDLDQ